MSYAALIKVGDLGGLRELLTRVKYTKNMANKAAELGQLAILKYLHETYHEVFCTPKIYEGAATNGHLPVVEYLFEHSIDVSDDAANCAARGGNIDVIKLFHSKGFEFSHRVCNFNAVIDRIDLLKFFYSIGYKATSEAFLFPCRFKGNEVVIFLCEQGLKPSIDNLNDACHDGNIELVTYLVEVVQVPAPTGKGKTLDNPITSAVCSGDIGLVRYLLSKGYLPDHRTLYCAGRRSLDEIFELVKLHLPRSE